MRDPFDFVRSAAFPALVEGQADSLEHTLELARKRVDTAARDVAQELNVSGAQANPEMLAERIREVRRRQEVMADIAGLQVAVGAAGKS